MNKEKWYSVGKIQKSIRKIVERDKVDILTHE